MQQKSQSPEGRFFLAIAMTFAFLFVWFNFFAPKPVKKELAANKLETQALQNNDQSAINQSPITGGVVSADTAVAADAQVQLSNKVHPLWNESFETSLFKFSFSNVGGGLNSIVSKKHFKSKGSDQGVD